MARLKNLVLIGISGSGKTVMGKRLAHRLSREFIDLDSLIQEREGLSIPQIFEERGEEGFRRAETEAVKAVSGCRGAIIACGGGAVLKEINMELLSQNGTILFMNRRIQDILSRVNLENRPLLSKTPEKLHEQYRERLPLYEKYGDLQVRCDGTPNGILDHLTHISRLEQRDKRLAVIGDPIAHSLSPDIHLPAMRPFLKSLSYDRIRVLRGEFPQWFARIRERGLDGFNVTMPYKKAIIPLLDRIDKEASELGSVNTVVRKKGELWGYSTDGKGFARALASVGESFRGSAVTIIGSGGAAVTIAMRAAKEGARELHLVARDLSKARDIAGKIKESYQTDSYLHSFLNMDGDGSEWNSRIIINATPLGMEGIKEGFPRFDFLDLVKEDAILCDLIYSPTKTKLLVEAGKRGLRTLGGINMLIEQALEADRLYLGAEIMRVKAYNRVIDNLRGKVEEL
ncbi:MAG: shikimate kinase [Anaerovoracaceae bacterium]